MRTDQNSTTSAGRWGGPAAVTGPPLPPPGKITYCHAPRCGNPSHVVLFAHPGELAGRDYYDGERVFLCHRHGSDVLDAIRALAGTHRPATGYQPVADWLRDSVHRLPRVQLEAHKAADNRPAPWTPPTRNRTRTPRPM